MEEWIWMKIEVGENYGSTGHRPSMCPLNMRMAPEECG